MKKAEPQSVYAMLGYADHESMEVKARLASQISDVIHARRLTQSEAADMIGVPQPKLSQLLRGQFRGISEAKMMHCLISLGKDVDIIIRAAPRSRRARVSVTSQTRAKKVLISAGPQREAESA